MPCADFRSKGDALDPLALVKLLAVMCHPADARRREGMLRRSPFRMIIARHGDLKEKQVGHGLMELWTEFREHRKVAFLAGALCLSMARFTASGRYADAAALLTMTSQLVGTWNQVIRRETAKLLNERPHQCSAREIFDAFSSYRSVSHLWAALVFGKIQNRSDCVLTSLETVPRFLSCSTEIGRLATTLRWSNGDQGLALFAESIWTFILPTTLAREANAEVYLTSISTGQQSPLIESGD
jgi:hypothetical protein